MLTRPDSGGSPVRHQVRENHPSSSCSVASREDDFVYFFPSLFKILAALRGRKDRLVHSVNLFS